MGADIAIDLGTSRTRIYVDKHGLVVDEPTVVAVNSDTGEIIAVGEKAYQMVGRVSKKVAVVWPLEGGAISDFYLVEGLISKLFKRVSSSKIVMPRVVTCVPGEITEVEKRALVNVISSIGVRKVCLIEEPIAAAKGAGLDINSPHGRIIVDIGGGTTNIAIISLGGIASSKSIKVAGNTMDDEIIKYVRRNHSMFIGKRMAEDAKKAIGRVFPSRTDMTYRLKGRDSVTGLPKTLDITSDEMLDILSEPAMQIVKQIQQILEYAPPELAGDIYTDGITMTGGGAQLKGFSDLIAKKTKLKVTLANHPSNCVIMGAGNSLKYIDDLEKKGYSVMNPLTADY